MFGLFGKKVVTNSSFNSLLIAGLGEAVRKGIDAPTGEQLLPIVNAVLKNRNEKLSESQVNSVRACGALLQMHSGSEIMRLARKLNQEIPRGEIESYENLLELLTRRGILMSDEGYDFLKKYL